MTRSIRPLALVLVGLMVVAVAGPAAASVDIRKLSTKRFPKVEITLSAPGSTLGDKDVKVSENGKATRVLSVDPVGKTASVDAIMAIDTSGSMQGAPMRSAVKAAKRFVDTLPSWVSVGVVTFSSTVNVVAKPTHDTASLDQAITRLKAGGETALFDAVDTGAKLFPSAGQHNLIVLTDGANTTGKNDLASAVKSAREANATVYTVGLETPETDVKAMKTIASKTGGSYAPAVSADLKGIYDNLAHQIGDQYTVTYRSMLGAGKEAEVKVITASGKDASVMQAPQHVASKPAQPPVESSGITLPGGTTVLVLGLAGSFLAVFALVFLSLGGRARARRRRRLEHAVRPIASRPGHLAQEQPSGLVEGVQKAAEAATSGRLGQLLDNVLEQSGVKMRRDELLSVCVAGLVGGLVLGLLLSSLLLAFLFAVLGGASPLIWVRFKANRRCKVVREKLPEVLSILASSLRAGHSFLQALDAVANEMEGPAGEEFMRVVTEVRLGRAVDDTLIDLAERIKSEDFKWAILAVNIQREVGGNLAEVLDNVSETLREREDIRRHIDVLAAEGKLSIWVLAALPFLFSIYLALVSPDWLGLLFGTFLGLAMVAAGSILLIVGILWMRKIVRIDV